MISSSHHIQVLNSGFGKCYITWSMESCKVDFTLNDIFIHPRCRSWSCGPLHQNFFHILVWLSKQGSRKKRIHGWRNFRRRQQNISSVTKYQQRCSNNMSCATLNVETGLNSMTLPFKSRHDDRSHLISGSFYSAQLEKGCKLFEAERAQNRYICSTTRSVLKHLDWRQHPSPSLL